MSLDARVVDLIKNGFVIQYPPAHPLWSIQKVVLMLHLEEYIQSSSLDNITHKFLFLIALVMGMRSL